MLHTGLRPDEGESVLDGKSCRCRTIFSTVSHKIDFKAVGHNFNSDFQVVIFGENFFTLVSGSIVSSKSRYRV